MSLITEYANEFRWWIAILWLTLALTVALVRYSKEKKRSFGMFLFHFGWGIVAVPTHTVLLPILFLVKPKDTARWLLGTVRLVGRTIGAVANSIANFPVTLIEGRAQAEAERRRKP